MNKTEESIKKLAAKNSASSWKEKVAYRKANKAWLRKATRISLRVLDAIDDKGWSQAHLARELEVTPQQVSKIIKGESDFKLSTISKLEEVLGIELVAVLSTEEVVMSEESIQKRVSAALIDYHRKWAKTQEYQKLRNQFTDPQQVLAVAEDEYAMAG